MTGPKKARVMSGAQSPMGSTIVNSRPPSDIAAAQPRFVENNATKY